MNKDRYFFKVTDRKIMMIVISLICLFSILLLYKLGTVPKEFVDEQSYMDEVKSLVYTGTDLNNLARPIYFKGPFGNGQSISYALFAVPFIKFAGFSVFKFRLPMVLLTIINIVLILLYLNKKSVSKSILFWVTLSFIAAPWVFISSRWVLDCNIAPITLSIGVTTLLFAIELELTAIQKFILLTVSALFITFSVYGYIAGWIFIPIFLLLFLIYLLRIKQLSLKWLLVYIGEIGIMCLPLIVFAYHLVILRSTKNTTWGPFSLPGMSMQRGSSFIDFNDGDGIIHAMIINVINGIQTYMQGFDHLAWNSVEGFGMIFPILLVFALIGIFTPKLFLSQCQFLFKCILCLALISYVPSLLIVKPNFNHWTFLNMVLILLAGYGLYYASLVFGKKYSMAMVIIVFVLSFVFITHFYFNNDSYFVKGSSMTSKRYLYRSNVGKIPAKKIKWLDNIEK